MVLFSKTSGLARLLFAMLLLSACGRAPVVEIGREFQPHVDRFVALSREVGKPVEVVDLRVQFGPTKPRENGVCDIKDDAPPTITINQTVWDRLDDAGKEALVFHELGHCVLRRDHSTQLSDEGVPVSLMYPKRIDSGLYVKYEDRYVQELFAKGGEF